MAGQAVNAVALAVTGDVTNRVFSALIQRYGKDAATSEKLQRLEMLLIMINSAVEASEKLANESSWLLKWLDKLKEAASRGQEVGVLASFPRCTDNADGNQEQQGEAAPSTAAVPAHATTYRYRCRSSVFHEEPSICIPALKWKKTEEMPPAMFCCVKHNNNNEQLACFDLPLNLACFQKEQQFMLLHDRLEAALGEISKAVKLADRHDLEELEWLTYWANILTEAKEQGQGVLDTTIISQKITRGR
uniref:Rx N-terminal domain-containing protein n=1 Tax=Aegilops tauschii TaxID=37682 RepID=M8C4I7_AEGTA